MSADRVAAALRAAIPDIDQGHSLTVDSLAIILDIAATEVAAQITEKTP